MQQVVNTKVAGQLKNVAKISWYAIDLESILHYLMFSRKADGILLWTFGENRANHRPISPKMLLLTGQWVDFSSGRAISLTWQ
jgi:hypothetical protein